MPAQPKLADLDRIVQLKRQLDDIDGILSTGISAEASMLVLADGCSRRMVGVAETALMCGLQDLRDQTLASLREVGISTEGQSS